MAKTLKEQFSIIRDREEVLNDIHSQPELSEQFYSWSEEQRDLFLEYCTGVRGIKLLYDQYFKVFLDPSITPERLEEILSLILQENVQILQVLPNESVRIAAEKSLLVLDIVVQLEDGSIANVEVQKIGYNFPGQRSACYSADLLMRQYKRVKGVKKKKFRYSDIKKVYTIVFFEKSTKEFQQYPDVWIHRSRQQSDTGIKIELLQEYVFIALDIFSKNLHNGSVNINGKLEAWLLFLSIGEPEWILNLVEVHPEFEALYQEVYTVCRNTEVMMGLFSEELLEMDKNTVEYMIDEMQNTIDKQNYKLKVQDKQLEDKDKQLENKDKENKRLEKLVKDLQTKLAGK